MVTVMNKRNGLNVEGKLKVIRGIDIGKIRKPACVENSVL